MTSPVIASARQQQRNPLKAWREKNHVTQAQLADAIDVHFTVISQWEQSRTVPTLQRFSRLVSRTGIPVLPLLHFFVEAQSEIAVDDRAGPARGSGKKSKR